MSFSAIELCAGGGGQALGLEMAGFHHEALVEYEPHFCCTLRKNRPQWNTFQEDIRDFAGEKFAGADLLAGGVPCPPFSIAGKQLGAADDRDMFPAALALIQRIKPRGVLLENVPGLATAKFAHYRNDLLASLSRLGYQPEWKVLQAADFGVPQLRPRFVLVALQPKDAEFFEWPEPSGPGRTVGDTLVDLMGANAWRALNRGHAAQWASLRPWWGDPKSMAVLTLGPLVQNDNGWTLELTAWVLPTKRPTKIFQKMGVPA
jgi:DNA (cytosine-5)-methyltransferase 1